MMLLASGCCCNAWEGILKSQVNSFNERFVGEGKLLQNWNLESLGNSLARLWN